MSAGARKEQLIKELEETWAELERRDAIVTRIPLSSHPSMLGAQLEHDRRRLRALDEGPVP